MYANIVTVAPEFLKIFVLIYMSHFFVVCFEMASEKSDLSLLILGLVI